MGASPASPIVARRFPRFLKVFEPAPPASVAITDPAEIQSGYRRWQRRVLISSIIGYATFYFVRKNLGMAMPVMEQQLGISKSGLGLFLTLHGVLYGVSKFANGFFGDRCHARTFMVAGLVASAIMNVCFGFGSAVVTFGVVWMLNGWFQGMGFPPCARLLTHWFPPKRLATKMSIWNTSHSIGAGLVVVLCSYLIKFFHDWRLCFFVPAGLAFACAIFLWSTLPDTPPSVGLPEVEGTRAETAAEKAQDVWAVLDWGPTLLTQAKHIELTHAGWMVFAFEIAGLMGALLGGWLTDRFFGGRGLRACVFYMALAGVSLLLFWKVGGQSKLLNTLLLCAAGFFIYGPQCLVGIAAANLATKRAAATSVGLTGLFGYTSTVLSGWGLGKLVQTHGWDVGFAGMLGVAAVGTILFAAGWGAKAHGYLESDT